MPYVAVNRATRLSFTTLRLGFNYLQSRVVSSSSKPMEAGKAYLRNLSNEDFEINFNLKTKFSFKFVRNSNNSVGSLLKRINFSVAKKLAKKLDSQDINVNASLLLNGSALEEEIICRDVFQNTSAGELSLHVNDELLQIIIDPPWIDSLSLPKVLLSGFYIYPIKLSGTFDESISDFHWYKSKSKKWQECGGDYFCLIPPEDENYLYKLICTPKNAACVGPTVTIISDKVLKGPEKCLYESRHEFTKEVLPQNQFRVVCYNMLADRLSSTKEAKESIFHYCDPSALPMQYRLNLLMKEILGYNGDVVCLQEIDKKHFEQSFEPLLKKFGMKGMMTQSRTNGTGNCFFYRSTKFSLMDFSELDIGKNIKNPMFKDIWKKIESNDQLVQRFETCNTGVQVMVVQSLSDPKSILVVGNTHLYFHPDADHIRLLQAIVCVVYTQSVAKEISESYPDSNVSRIICGDFNSVPTNGPYKLMVDGFVDSNFPDWSSAPGENIEDLSFTNPVKYGSAYGAPPFTNYTEAFKDCIDYIYYELAKLKVNQVVPIPSEEELKQEVALPSRICPSDHIALIADMEWKS